MEEIALYKYHKNITHVKNPLLLFKHYNPDVELYCCLCAGFTITKPFWGRMIYKNLPDLTNDEVSLPIYEETMGAKLNNTLFMERWFSPKAFITFYYINRKVYYDTVNKELSIIKGKRVFHFTDQKYMKYPLTICN